MSLFYARECQINDIIGAIQSVADFEFTSSDVPPLIHKRSEFELDLANNLSLHMYSNKGVFHSDNGSSGHGTIVIDFQPFNTKLHEYLALYQYLVKN